MNDYLEFLETKKKNRIESGFDVNVNGINPALFDFQRYCVHRGLKARRFALFEDCGLGKTLQQLEWKMGTRFFDNPRRVVKTVDCKFVLISTTRTTSHIGRAN